jgi:hypothetical protein
MLNLTIGSEIRDPRTRPIPVISRGGMAPRALANEARDDQRITAKSADIRGSNSHPFSVTYSLGPEFTRIFTNSSLFCFFAALPHRMFRACNYLTLDLTKSELRVYSFFTHGVVADGDTCSDCDWANL